jgi:biotin carboxyl carrier protein
MNKYQYKVQGVDYDVEIEEVEGNIAKVNVNGIRFDVEMKQPINPASTLKKVHVQAPKPVSRPSVAPAAAAAAAPAPQAAPAGAGSPVKAPLPGTITELKVNVGDTVKVGDVVLVLEAMKMQNNIESEYAGTVTAINTKPGESVMEGAVLMTIG